MCTATWLIEPDGYQLFFNRDESVRRGRALAPELLSLGGVRALAPLDPDAGGTWLGVNEWGLCLGLLNGWQARPASGRERSRGLLVREHLDARTADELASRLAAAELGAYRAFSLLVLEPGRNARVHHWNGERLEQGVPDLPLCSSSLDGTRARSERRRSFERLSAEGGPGGPLQAGLLERFQSSHLPERGPWSPCMHREDARTVSASRVQLGPEGVVFRYADGAPCETAFGIERVLPRRQL